MLRGSRPCPVNASTTVFEQLNRLTLPTAISIASFEATFFVAGRVVGLSEREVVLGVLAAAAGGISVLGTVLWQATRRVTPA
jgi:hypothetical protein